MDTFQTQSEAWNTPLWWLPILAGVLTAVVLFNTAHGGFAGIYKILASATVLLLSALAAWQGGPIVAEWIAPYADYPQAVLSVLGAATAWAVMSMVGSIIVRIMVPHTRQVPSGAARVSVGFTGLVVGTFIGLFYAALLLVAIQAVGSYGLIELRQENGLPPKDPLSSADAQLFEHSSALRIQITANPRTYEPILPEPPSGILGMFTQLKVALDESPVGVYMPLFNPMRHERTEVLEQTLFVIQNEDARRYFQSDRRTQALLNEPKVKTLTEDPELIALAQEGHYAQLLRHEKVVQALDSGELQRVLEQYDYTTILKDSIHKYHKAYRPEANSP